MSILKLVYALISTSLMTLITTSNAIKGQGFTCDYVGPLPLKTDDKEVTFKYSLGSTYENAVEIIECNVHGYPVSYTQQNEPHRITMNLLQNVTFKIPFSTLFFKEGLDIKLKVVNYTTKLEIISSSSTIYPIGISSIDTSDLNDGKYTSNNISFSFLNGLVRYKRCSYDFTNMARFFPDNSFLYLDLSELSFKYTADYNFTYGVCQMKFYDEKNLFPYIAPKSDGFKHVQIDLVNNDNILSLKFKKSFYYDSKTLQISDMWRSGFENSEYFYLPKNSIKDLLNYEFIFVLNDIGADKVTVTHKMKLQSDRNVFGSCNDSDYCINGGVIL